MLKGFKSDLSSGVVVFFVALPLCLGIALASGAPLFSGLISGIVGGIVVGVLSGSSYGVSGPAAGLTVIVLSAINSLGYESFLLAVVLAGAIQLILGILKSGSITYFFPGSVIKGMLSAIGVIIILKQIPHFFGYDMDPEGDLKFAQNDGQNSFTELFNMLDFISYPSFIIGLLSLAILIFANLNKDKKWKLFSLIPPALMVVLIGAIYAVVFATNSTMAIKKVHLVNVPSPDSINSFFQQFTTPEFSGILNPEIWITAFTIAIVASLETLLCLNATDKLAPGKKVTPPNRELLAQGAGNL
ncbi:MAG: SulP family inorganic anion transporter, partial [Crocinitomicaceae bacterium]|nr:SulP family inorganic anion transporter [Crocinitomicaceae bacterium]